MVRYDGPGTMAPIATWWAKGEPRDTAGGRWELEGGLPFRIAESGRPDRIDDWAQVPGELGEYVRTVRGLTASVGTPISVDGRLWGAVMVHSRREHWSFPVGSESRIANFTELVATAIANIEARTAVAASRARIVAATDEARRRFERDLHDGAQQRLVSLTLALRGVEAMTPPELAGFREELTKVGDGITEVLDDLRELSRGLHPAILAEGGLAPALRALARRSALPVVLEGGVARRLDPATEVAAYYVVSETLANASKHAEASKVAITVAEEDDVLVLAVADDGVGGADPARGSGLLGIIDRVEALGGSLTLDSPPGGGTEVRGRLPLGCDPPASRREE
jgi:signal transduction histidine kinase